MARLADVMKVTGPDATDPAKIKVGDAMELSSALSLFRNAKSLKGLVKSAKSAGKSVGDVASKFSELAFNVLKAAGQSYAEMVKNGAGTLISDLFAAAAAAPGDSDAVRLGTAA